MINLNTTDQKEFLDEFEKIEMQIPFIMKMEDYHEGNEMRSVLKDILGPDMNIDFKEVGFDGQYIFLGYMKDDKKQVDFEKKLSTYLYDKDDDETIKEYDYLSEIKQLQSAEKIPLPLYFDADDYHEFNWYGQKLASILPKTFLQEISFTEEAKDNHPDMIYVGMLRTKNPHYDKIIKKIEKTKEIHFYKKDLNDDIKMKIR